MHITIVGAGPVGLLLACLLSHQHTVTVIDKRTEHTRAHSLNISANTVSVIHDYLSTEIKLTNPGIIQLYHLLTDWSNNPVNTIEIETKLSEIAINLGVTIQRGITIDSLDGIKDSIIIGADGAKSKIRSLVFGDELMDVHNVRYMVQLKYQTPGATKPRLTISAASYSFLNGLSGSDMVIDFESLAPPNTAELYPVGGTTSLLPNDSLRKQGTLHIPVPESVYDILTQNGKGNFSNPWTIQELSTIKDPHIAKLVRIIKRYEFSLKWRGGWFENPRITVVPLNIYRSPDVVKILDDNKLVMLCGDSASGLVFQRGLNKGWLEAVKCAQTLLPNTPQKLSLALSEYSQYCLSLYESERDAVLSKHKKIVSINTSTSATGIVLTSGLGLLFTSLLNSKIK